MYLADKIVKIIMITNIIVGGQGKWYQNTKVVFCSKINHFLHVIVYDLAESVFK